MTDTLFDIADHDPGQREQTCDLCPADAVASDDGLRVRGWHVFDGRSATGKQLHVRICPACQRRAKEEKLKGNGDYPDRYLKCPVCRVEKAAKCVSRSGRVVDGRPDGVQIELTVPHKARKLSRRQPK